MDITGSAEAVESQPDDKQRIVRERKLGRSKCRPSNIDESFCNNFLSLIRCSDEQDV